jgi:hypothetical protein
MSLKATCAHSTPWSPIVQARDGEVGVAVGVIESVGVSVETIAWDDCPHEATKSSTMVRKRILLVFID